MSRSVGVDLHRRRSQVAILDEAGGVVSSRQVVNNPAHQDTYRRVAERKGNKVAPLHWSGLFTATWTPPTRSGMPIWAPQMGVQWRR